MLDRRVLASAVLGALLVATAHPVFAQSSTSLRSQLVAIGTPLGSAQGMTALASLASLEVSTAPLGTSTGGFTYSFDPLRGTWSRTAASFGPAFAERSLTTGRAKVSVGFNWLHASYSSFNDQQLDNGEFRPARNVVGFAPLPAVSYSALNLDLTSDTLVFFGHVGVTNKLDVGVALPWIQIGMGAEGGLFNAAGANLAASTIADTSASGIGDVALFGKYRVIEAGEGGVAVAAEVRLPTGDRNEFRGLDVTRTLVSGIWSHPGRVSPHANVGYEFWSDEVPLTASGDIFAKDQFKYAVGVEFTPHPLATVVVDFVGRTVRHGGQVAYQTFPGAGGSSIDALVAVAEGVHQTALAPGVKFNAFRKMLITANVLVALSNDGLRANAVPVIGVDWSF